jgi:hypothetical protein
MTSQEEQGYRGFKLRREFLYVIIGVLNLEVLVSSAAPYQTA